MSDSIQENTDSEINLLDLLIALGQEKWTLIVVTFLAALIGVVISLTTPPSFVSRTSIMPSQQSVGGGGGLASLGGLAGLASIGALSNITSGIKSSDEMYIALMRSQSVQSAMVKQLNLKERYGVKNTEEARQVLTINVSVMTDKKSGLLIIDAQDKDPEFAAKLAKTQVDELNVILSRLAVTEAQQRRAYYDQQILKTQVKIPILESEFKEAQKSSGLEVVSLLSEAGTLPGQIAAKELQIHVLSRFATTQNPDIKRLTLEVSALRAQMSRYDLSKTGNTNGEPSRLGQALVNTKTNFVQKATQAYNTLKIQEALLDGYFKQLELAKLDEAKEGPSVQVVDEARVPEIRAKPERKKIVLAYSVTGLVIAILVAALRAFMRSIQSTPLGQQRWLQLKRAWGFA